MRRHRLALAAAAATVLATVGLTAAPASAVTRTVFDRLNNETSSRATESPSHVVQASGYFRPGRPTGSRVYIQRHTSTGWTTIASTTKSWRYVGPHGPYTQFMWSRTVAWGVYQMRACVHATSTSTAACSPVSTQWLGRNRTNLTLPVVETTGAYSTGPIDDVAGFTRWPGTQPSGSVTYDLRGRCHELLVSPAVASSSDTDNNLGDVTFTVYRNGTLWKTAVAPELDLELPGQSASAAGIQTLKVVAQGQGVGVPGQYFGFSLWTFCTF